MSGLSIDMEFWLWMGLSDISRMRKAYILDHRTSPNNLLTTLFGGPWEPTTADSATGPLLAGLGLRFMIFTLASTLRSLVLFFECGFSRGTS